MREVLKTGMLLVELEILEFVPRGSGHLLRDTYALMNEGGYLDKIRLLQATRRARRRAVPIPSNESCQRASKVQLQTRFGRHRAHKESCLQAPNSYSAQIIALCIQRFLQTRDRPT